MDCHVWEGTYTLQSCLGLRNIRCLYISGNLNVKELDEAKRALITLHLAVLLAWDVYLNNKHARVSSMFVSLRDEY